MKHCEGIITKNVKFKGLKKGSKQRRDEQREDEEDFFRFEEGIQNPKKNITTTRRREWRISEKNLTRVQEDAEWF